MRGWKKNEAIKLTVAGEVFPQNAIESSTES